MRHRYLRVSAEILADAFQPASLVSGFQIRADGIPTDMKIVGCFWEYERTVVLVVESASFDVLAEGATPPDFVPVFHQELATA